MISETLKGAPVTGKAKSGKGKKGGADADTGLGIVNGTNMRDFRTEYAKSGGSTCGPCETKIAKGNVRIGKKDYDSMRAKMYSPFDR